MGLIGFLQIVVDSTGPTSTIYEDIVKQFTEDEWYVLHVACKIAITQAFFFLSKPLSGLPLQI